MKKTLITGLLVLAGTSSSSVWVQAPTKLTSGSVLKAELKLMGITLCRKKIPEARLKFFLHQWKLFRQDGEKQTLIQKKGENYQYQSEKALSDGSYWVTATYKPTFGHKMLKVGKWII